MNSQEDDHDTERPTREQVKTAMLAARLDAIRENQRFGLPMIFERDGQIVHIDPFEAEADLLKGYSTLAVWQASVESR